MGLPILPLFLIFFIVYRTGVVVSPKLSLNFCHTVACTRRRTSECGKPKRIPQFSHPLRSIVTRLITAPCKSSSGRRKLYQGTWYYGTACSMFQTQIFTYSHLLRHSLAADARALNPKEVYCAFTAKQAASQMF